MSLSRHLFPGLACAFLLAPPLSAAPLTVAGQPARLDIRAAGASSLRITLKPQSYPPAFPVTPVLPDRPYPEASLSLTEISAPQEKEIAGLKVTVRPDPATVEVRAADGSLTQSIAFAQDGSVSFALDEQPVLGLGEGGPSTPKGKDWRKEPVQFDRRGAFDKMEPHWQREAYGSRNPVPLLIGTRGWALHFNAPWGQVDLTDKTTGRFIPIVMKPEALVPQTFKNQHNQLAKGIPPASSVIPGLVDLFVFDARDPAAFMRDLSGVAGAAVMPPLWSLGYMQSHRTLEDDAAMVKVVDTFREKRIPIDAVIYLGTGFTPRGWNKHQPSFEFNPEVFRRDPATVIADLHQRNVKVALHMVPWDRDKLPSLKGSIPPLPGEAIDSSHISTYWPQHEPLVKLGVDAWWPDEGDWFDLHERVTRHRLYHQGPISTEPDKRPWSLHRNGHLGIARWGGWVWSGDTDASWKTLETQISVGINHSLSIGPYWGTDLGGFFGNKELTGELYARWFQFAAFCPSFRAHGRTWWTRLPWGWDTGGKHGPIEDPEAPLEEELSNPAIEPIARRYAELRYQLLSYNYTLAWQARETGLPFMRALWLHYPQDRTASAIGNQYLWGRDLLISPVFEKSATKRELYLPAGTWYDWWTGARTEGGRTISRSVNIATLPIHVRAGAIIPLDPVRQYTAEKSDIPVTLRIYQGSDGEYTLYEDDTTTNNYLKGDSVLTTFRWNDATTTLTVQRSESKHGSPIPAARSFNIELHPSGKTYRISAARIETDRGPALPPGTQSFDFSD